MTGGADSGSDVTNWSAAQPGAYPDSGDVSESFTVEVDGELFAVSPGAWGGTDYTWLSGPNEGYGFSESPTPDRSLDHHRQSIRGFLAQVDPDTGYIE